jgi:very-short-patch-repair endonuclease
MASVDKPCEHLGFVGRERDSSTMSSEPFLGSEAMAGGRLTRHQLRTRYRRLYRDVYLAPGVELTAASRARAAWLSMGDTTTLAGLSAAAVLGTKWLDAGQPAEVIKADRGHQPGIVVRSYDLHAAEIMHVRGMRVTTPARTAFDIGRTRPTEDVIPILDALLRATDTKPADVLAIADARPGARGVRRLTSLLDRVDGGAESPKETQLRLLLVDAGLPRPETQIEFRDRWGRVRVRVDMGWREWKVAVEYDGLQHWADARQRSWDIERIALLEASGWTVIRVSAEMMSRPHVVIGRVVAKLRAAGCPI